MRSIKRRTAIIAVLAVIATSIPVNPAEVSASEILLNDDAQITDIIDEGIQEPEGKEADISGFDEISDPVSEPEDDMEEVTRAEAPETDILIMPETEGEPSGNIGKIKWIISDEGELTVDESGSGANYSIKDHGVIPWLAYKDQIKSATVKSLGNVTDLSGMFEDCSNLASVDFSEFRVTNATDMSNMFKGCTSLTAIDLSSFKPASATDMSGMFKDCTALTDINLNGFGPLHVSNISGMFEGCSSLTGILASGFDITWVENMSNMFKDCSALTSVDLDYSNTLATNVSGMFSGCSALNELDLSRLNMKNITEAASAADMLTGALSINKIKVPYNIQKKVIIPLPSDNWYVEGENIQVDPPQMDSTTKMGWVLINGDIPQPSKVLYSGTINGTVDWCIFEDGSLSVNGTGEIHDSQTNEIPWLEHSDCIVSAKITLDGTTDLSGMFKGCSCLSGNNALDLAGLDTSSAVNMSEMFAGCSSLTAIDVSMFDTSQVTDMSGMFSGCSGLTSLNISKFDTSALTDVANMFAGCSSLTSIDLTGFGSSGTITDLSGIFRDCSKLTEIDISYIDLTAVSGSAGVEDVFAGCDSLESVTSPYVPTFSIALPGIGWTVGTDRVDSMEAETASGTVFEKADDIAQGRFEGGTGTWWIDSSGVLHVKGSGDVRDGSQVHADMPWYAHRADIKQAVIELSGATDLSMMFDGCSELTSVDLTGLDTSSCTDMYVMFRGCLKLTSVDLSGFDTGLVKNMNGMFSGCQKLAIPAASISAFDTSKVTDIRSMFDGCKAVTALDLSGFDLSLVKGSNASDMLRGCESLASVISPDGLSVDINLPVIANKGWSRDNAIRAAGEKVYKIPANTKKGTEYTTTQNITVIKLYKGGTEIKDAIDLDPGAKVRITAKVTPANADPWDIAWTSGDSTIATVAADRSTISGTEVEAEITALDKQGTVVITAAAGNVKATVTVRTNQIVKLDRNTMTIESGKSDKLTATVAAGSGYSVTDLVWTSSDTRTANVDDDGNVTAVAGIGKTREVTITVSTPDGKYKDICIVTVKPDPDAEVIDWGDLDDETKLLFDNDVKKVPTGLWYLMPENGSGTEEKAVYRSGGILDFHMTYNGTNRTFDEKTAVFYGVRKLWSRRDYRISYRNNKAAAYGSDRKPPIMTIAGTGSFKNVEEFKFSIDPEDINNANLHSEAEVVIDSKTKVGTVTPSVRYNGSKLVLDRDYVLTYYKDSVADGNEIDNPKKYKAAVGEVFYIKISAKNGGNFTGSMTDPVKIVTIDPSDKNMVRMTKVKAKLHSVPWTGEPYSLKELFDNSLSDNDAVRVTFDKNPLKYGDDFTVDDISFTDAGRYTISLHGKGSAGASEKKFYGDKKVIFEITGVRASKVKFAAFSNSVYYNNGAPITMEDLFKEDNSGYDKVTLYTVKSGRQEVLIEDRDYTYEMDNSGATGKFKLIFTLKGEYTGVIKKTITVLRYNMLKDTRNKMSVKVGKTVYCKAGSKPEVTVEYGGSLLRENIDYKLTFKNNIRVGTESDGQSAPKVTVTGIGNYSGDIVRKFDIEQASMDDIELILDDIEWKKKLGRGQFKANPWIMNGGKALKMREDIEYVPKSQFIYRYADTGEIIDDKATEFAPNTKVEVRVTIECKDGRPFKPGVRELIGYYTIREKSKDLKNATSYIREPSNIVCTDTEEEIRELLIANMEISVKDSNGNKTVLLNGRDFEITEVSNYNVSGTATVVIEGRGIYGGKKTVKVKIYRRKQ